MRIWKEDTYDRITCLPTLTIKPAATVRQRVQAIFGNIGHKESGLSS